MNLTGVLQIPVSLKSKFPTQLSVTHAKYDFLGLLSVTESLASRGRKLHDTPLQRQQPAYAPDVIMRVEVVASYHKLVASYIEDGQLVLIQGENKLMRLLLTNDGSRPISEVWMVAGAEDEIWVGATDDDVMQDCAYLNWEAFFFLVTLYLMQQWERRKLSDLQTHWNLKNLIDCHYLLQISHRC